ncbi:MAG: hypothetical protein SFV52_14070 [Saprospiraceae bacterium]|nr:hypothetical protein [Saprospiraceae bacterium]
MGIEKSVRPWSYGEVALLEAVVLLVLWLWSDYTAALLTLVLVCIVLAALLLALISEWLEPSRVPRRYFVMALVLVLTALGVGVLYVAIMGARLDFLDRL